MASDEKRSVVCVFHDVAGFEGALKGLLKAGFDASAISVLGRHDEIVDHFGQVPRPEEMSDAADTPRETLETEVALHKAIDYLSDALALISEVGAAAAAYAVGGPVGVAAGSADLTETTVDNILSGFVDGNYRGRFEQSVRDGGLICWVQTPDDATAAAAVRLLEAAGAGQIHQTELSA